MSRLDVNTLRHTAGSADNITLDNSQNATVEGNLTVDGTTTLTGAVELPDDTVDIADLSASGTASSSTYLRGDNSWASVSTQQALSFRNVVINGAMEVSQRNTSFSGLTSGATYTLDRFAVAISNAGTWTVTQDSDAPDTFANSLKLDCTTADTSLGGGDYIHIWHKIEKRDANRFGNGKAGAKKFGLSFWVKSNKTGTYTMEIYNAHANRGTSKAYTIDSADTWEKKTLLYNADTAGGVWGVDNGEGLRIYMYFATGLSTSGGTFRDGAWDANVQANRRHPSQVNLADSTSNYLNITGIQLEALDAGDVCTAFEHRQFGEELLRCQRYYEKSYPYSVVPGSAGDNGRRGRRVCASATNQTVFTNEQYQVRKRATPTLTTYSNNGSSGQVMLMNYGSTTVHANSSVYGNCDYGFEVSGSGTANAIAVFWQADAEL